MPTTRRKARQSQQSGAQGERIARHALHALGFEMIERIHTPVKIISKHKSSGKGKITGTFVFADRVSGDFRAIDPQDGRSVLVEVKLRENRLKWSDFEPHQLAALAEHHDWGGLSIIVWVDSEDYTPFVLQWPIQHEEYVFKKRKPLMRDVAEQVCIRY